MASRSFDRTLTAGLCGILRHFAFTKCGNRQGVVRELVAILADLVGRALAPVCPTDRWTRRRCCDPRPPGCGSLRGRREGIRSQLCPRCAAAPGSPCLNAAGGETAEHQERVTFALRARGRHDIAALCGGHTGHGRQCGEEPLPDDVYCRTHRDKADRGLPI